MNADLMPPARPRKIDPKRVEKIREGWEKADGIRKQSDQDHKKNDVPAAEAQLLQDLKNID